MSNLCNGQRVAPVHLLFVWLDTLLSVEKRERGESGRGVNSTNPLSCLVVQLPTCHTEHTKRTLRGGKVKASTVEWSQRTGNPIDSTGSCTGGPTCHLLRAPAQREVLDLMQGAHSALSHNARHTEANILLASTGGVASIGAQAGELMSRKVLRLIMVA